MKVCKVAEVRNLDKEAGRKFGLSPEILMENAGQAVYFVILREFGIKNKRFSIFCGSGNNGGDGFVVARKIYSNAGEVKVFILGNKANLKDEARKNFEIISKMKIEIYNVKSVESIKPFILQSDAIIDAIFGTGLTRNIEGVYRDIIQLINESGKKVFSVDIPSGINGDTAEIMGTAIKADWTVTFGLPKIGNILYPGYDYCGKLYLSHISFPPSFYNLSSLKTEINFPLDFPVRLKDTHKGNYGKTLFIAGSSGYLGAPYFSAFSFLKAGGGLSYLATPKSISPFLANKGSEIVFLPQKETISGSIALNSQSGLLNFSEKVDMVVLGPGLSLNEETQRLVRELVKKVKKPLLIDGDGITAISEDIEIIKERKNKTILTPHLGEFSKITKIEINKIKKNKVDILRETTKELNAIIVLKGAHSLIGYPDGRVFVNMSGNPGMATAGSGDILTGTISCMYGLGLSIEEAVRMGVFIHGLAGDLASKDKGEDGITAQDILDYLPLAMKYYRDNFNKICKNFYKSIYLV